MDRLLQCFLGRSMSSSRRRVNDDDDDDNCTSAYVIVSNAESQATLKMVSRYGKHSSSTLIFLNIFCKGVVRVGTF